MAGFSSEENQTIFLRIMQNDCMIDPKLRVLQLVAQHGTVTAAAAASHYTPSAVSYQLRQLAEELGVPLLEAQGRGVQLTTAARTVLRHVDVLSAQAERAYAELATLAGEPSGPFTVCGFSTSATHLLPPVAATLRDRHPHVRMRVIEAEPGRCFDLLLAGDADLALVINTAHTPPTGDDRFHQEPLLDDPLDLVVPADHPFTTRRRVTLADAADQDWILGRPGTAYHDLVRTACSAAGFSPNIAHYADEWDTGAALVARRFGVILVPRLARLHDDRPVARVPLSGDPAPARRVLAATRSGHAGHPLVTESLEAINDVAAELLPTEAPQPR
ncbi:DNA-binding transcriptional regulator, LysR family [Prauserella halophila]|nr:DNA-binding transcriptional regulator, LysR family [Prauserella halophila]